MTFFAESGTRVTTQIVRNYFDSPKSLRSNRTMSPAELKGFRFPKRIKHEKLPQVPKCGYRLTKEGLYYVEWVEKVFLLNRTGISLLRGGMGMG